MARIVDRSSSNVVNRTLEASKEAQDAFVELADYALRGSDYARRRLQAVFVGNEILGFFTKICEEQRAVRGSVALISRDLPQATAKSKSEAEFEETLTEAKERGCKSCWSRVSWIFRLSI